jgi:hypothetical protein
VRIETGPFLFTPPSFGSLDRRDKRAISAADRGKLGTKITQILLFIIKSFGVLF